MTTDSYPDRLSPVLSLTAEERRRVRELAERDSASLLSAAYAAALGCLDNADVLIERMLRSVRCEP